MKSSKILLTSLLAAAAMSAVPAWAANYIVANGAIKDNGNKVASKGNSGATIDEVVNTTGVAVNAGDNFTFNGVTGYLPGWNNGTFVGNIILSAGSGSASAFVWNDGSSEYATTITFSGSLSGSGTFEKNTSSNNKRQCFKFTGDVSGFSGNFKLAAAEANNSGILTFGAGGAAFTGTYENGTAKSVSGTGQINWAGQSVVFNYNNTNAATVGNSSITTKTLTFSGGANYTVSSTVTGSDSTASNNTLTISAGTTTFTGAVSKFGTISVGSNATGKISSAYTNSGTLTKAGAGTLVFGNSARISNLTISDGIVQINNATGNTGENKRLTSVTIANEKALQVFNGSALSEATTIDSLTVSGASATVRIGTTENNGGNSHSGKVLIKDIAAGTGTLTLELKANTSERSIFELGESGVDSTGAFTGTIAFSGTNNGSNRSGSLVISNGAVASNAEISLASTASSGAILSLGVNASSVTIGGLSSTLGTTKAKVYSGAIELASDYNAAYGDSATSTGATRSLVIDAAEGKNFSFNGEILANLNLEKDGAGTQTLAGASATFNGSVTVAGGVLKLTNAAALGAGTSGDVLVKSGATLARAVDGTLSFGGTFTTESSAVLDLGNVAASAAAISATGDVTIADGTVFNLASLEDGAILAASSSGTLTKSGDVSVFLNGVAVGSRTGVSVNESNQLVLSNTKLTLTWAGTESDSWTVGGGVWKDTSETFQTGDNVVFDGNATVSAGDGIMATDISVASGSVSLSGGSVSAAGALTVSSGASLTVNEGVLDTVAGGISLEANSTLKLVGAAIHEMTNVVSGEGKVVLDKGSVISTEPTISTANVLTGAISVEKIGNTKVSITAAQSYTGGTTITAGIIGVGHNSALGSGTITLNGGQITAHIAALTLANAIEIGANGGTIHTNDNASNTITLNGAISGAGTLTKAGAGTLVLANADLLNGSSSFSSKILVSAGTLKLGNNTANLNIVKAETDGGIEVARGATLQIYGASSSHHKLAKDIVLNDGAFLRYYDASQATRDSYQYELSGTITVNGTATITGDSNSNKYWAKEVALLGNLSGSGTLKYYRGNGDNNFNSNGRLIIAGADNSGFTGSIVIGGQTTAVSQGLDLNADLANGTVSLQGGSGQAAYMRVLKSATIKGLNGNANSSVGIGNVLANGAVGEYTLTVGEGDFAGTIEDNGEARGYGQTASSKVTGAVLSIVKNTAGTLTLSGTNTFTGGIEIAKGVVEATNAAALGAAANAVRISGGQLKVGDVTLNQTNISVVLNDGAYLAGAAIFGTGSGALADGTTISVSGDVEAMKAVCTSATGRYDFTLYDNNTLTTTGVPDVTVVGDFATALAGAGWTYSLSEDKSILTISVPEPSAFGLLAGAGALALTAARRRRQKKA